VTCGYIRTSKSTLIVLEPGDLGVSRVGLFAGLLERLEALLELG
jgi:hypothetical protein